MNLRTPIFIASAILALSACGGRGSAAAERDAERLREQVRKLQLDSAQNETRLRALERQMDLIAMGGRGRQASAALPATGLVEDGAPFSTPGGLEVVRLSPGVPVVEEEEDDSFAFISLSPSRPASKGSPAPKGKGAAAAPPLPTRVELGTSSGAGEDSGFEAGSRALAAGRNEEAVEHLEGFLTSHPLDSRADNALLALGEAWLLREMPGRALQAFQRVVTNYPAGDAVPQALLRYGETCLALGRKAAARAAFARLADQFPENPATAQARGRLALLEEGES